MSEKKVSLNIGGRWAISWKIAVYALPFLLLIVPIAEGALGSWWAFWRWTLVSFISLIPLFTIFLLADLTVFKDRERNPLPNYYVGILGFILGFVRGATTGSLANFWNLLTLDDLSTTSYVLIRAVNAGFLGMIFLPFISIFAASLEMYQSDRNALIADRMLHLSQKSESMAVIKSLKSSMTRKVDENLLNVIMDSQEFFDEKGRSLEKNWELMAVRLRKAALDTIRPFSHHLHRAGEEKVYRVKLFELLRFVVSSFRIEPSWILMGYLALNFRYIFENSTFFNGAINLLTRILILYLGLQLIKAFHRKKSGWIFIINIVELFTFSIIFQFIVLNLNNRFGLANPNEYAKYVDSVLLVLMILAIGFVSAFFYGQHAESEFLERQLSKEQLEAMLLKREEERLSRELAKYLHGTIQSRLMASAMALEKAGRKGDKKALERELATAYESLRVPSASYFAAPEESLKAEVAKVVAKWSDLMKIKTKIEKSVDELAPAKSQEMGNAINEAISNSFRHGQATEVQILISKNKGKIKIEIIDNGSSPQKGNGGLGTEWFNAIAGSEWSLSRMPNSKGARLELFINP